MVSKGFVLSSEAFDEHRLRWGEFVFVEELSHNAFEVGHAAFPHFGVADAYLQGVLGGLGLYLEGAAFFNGEEDVGEDGFGGDGEVA